MLSPIFHLLSQSEEPGAESLQKFVQESIAKKSGAVRRPISELPSIFVQPIPLDPPDVGARALETMVDWIARRVKASGKGVFDLSVQKQAKRIVLIAQWPRSENPLMFAKPSEKAPAASRDFDRRSFTRIVS